jgi:hypothetical protein
MAELNVTQSEADALISMPKLKANDDVFEYPGMGGSVIIPLVSEDRRENFLLDISRGRIDLKKGTYQNRARKVVILARLDFGGPPHRNPDGGEIPSPHLHVYREGFGDKWAAAVPADKFPNIDDAWKTLVDFMAFCNIKDTPRINRGLFT